MVSAHPVFKPGASWAMFQMNPCYVAVDHTSVGPVPIDLVIRGIEHRKIPPEALVCEVGKGSWVPLASVPVFHAAVVRSYPPPPPDSAEAQYWAQQGFHFPSLGALPRFDDDLVSLELLPEDDLEAEVDVEWSGSVDAGVPRIDWSHAFHAYFLVGDDLELPEERALLASMTAASREVFQHDEALWNLALCLAFGSDELGKAAAETFFGAVVELGSYERLEWMRRTLLGDGFVPSGIPVAAGQRAFERLRSLCPPSLGAIASPPLQ